MIRKKSSRKQRSSKSHRLFHLRNHPFVVPVVTFIVLFFVSLIAFVNFGATTIGPADSRVVNVFVDGEKQTLPSRAPNVDELLQRLDITLNEGDIVEPKKETQIIEDDFTVNIYRARPVTVVDGSKRVTVLSAEQSARAVAEQTGINLHPEDEVVASTPENVIEEGVVAETFVVERSIPVTLVLFGEPYDIRTHAKTVGELVDEKQIDENTVTVFPSVQKKLQSGDVVYITSPGKKIVIKEEKIPFEEEIVEDPELEMGEREVRKKGVNGKKVVVYEVDVKNPKKRKALQSIVATKPVKQVVARGTKLAAPGGSVSGSKADWMRSAGIDPSQYQYVDYIIGRESGWNPGAISPNRCIGLGQRCNPSLLTNECPNWQTDPVCQLGHFSAYAEGRYGSWQGAYSAWQVQGWW